MRIEKALQAMRDRTPRPAKVDEAGLLAEYEGRHDSESGMAIKVLSGFGAFFASLVFQIVLWSSGTYDDSVSSLFFGFLLIGVALYLGSQRRETFLATVTICGFLVGVGLILVGSSYMLEDGYLVIPLVAVALTTILFTKNPFLIFLSVVALPVSLLWLHAEIKYFFLTELAILLSAGGLVAWSILEAGLLDERRFRPVRTGLAVGLALSLVWFRWGGWMVEDPLAFRGEWIFAGLLYLLTLWTIWYVLPAEGSWMVGIAVSLLPLVALPTLLGSFLLLFISYRNTHFMGIGLGVAGLLYFTAQYYYDLRLDLLDKSLILMASGALLLALYYFVQRKYPTGDPL